MKRLTVIFLLICSILTGCGVAVVVGAAAGMVVYDRRSMSTIESDARIFYNLNKSIVGNPSFRGSHIVITSFNQIVLLVGQTSSPELKELAGKMAKSTPNVFRVYNQITIQPPSSLTQRSKDTWITSQVRTEMLTKKGLESGSIRIVTEDGVVFLMGIASHEQANLAVDVARRVQGVKKVVKVFRYIV